MHLTDDNSLCMVFKSIPAQQHRASKPPNHLPGNVVPLTLNQELHTSPICATGQPSHNEPITTMNSVQLVSLKFN